MTGWVNWGGNQAAPPSVAITHPSGTAEIAAVVIEAARAGRRVKAIGSGHSFTGIGRPEDVQLVLDRHAGVVAIDTRTARVTVQAGMTLHHLNALLDQCGLSLTNLGDIDCQTVAGAISTGTHGTGARAGGIATQVRALTMVLADGSQVSCSPEDEAQVFAAARVGLGALGIIDTVTIQAEPAFALHAVEGPMPMADVLGGFDELVESADHVEFYWFPHTDVALTKRNTRRPLEAGLAPLPAWRGWLDDEFLSNAVFGALVGAGRRAPALVPVINRVAARALGARSFTDVSHRVFTSPRRVRFVEMEYAVPRAAIVGVIEEVRARIDASGWRIPFPVEVRVAAADDITLSTAQGRETAYLAVHVPRGAEHETYFRAVEEIACQVGGRPHWGKVHYRTAEQLRAVYPRFEEFVALRERLDPQRVFGNAYLERVLGA